MTLTDEIGDLASWVVSVLPGSQIYRYLEPEHPADGDLAILPKQEAYRSETRSHILIERQISLIVYAQDAEMAVQRMERLIRSLMLEGGAGLALEEAPRVIRADSFSLEPPEQLDSGIIKCGGTIQQRLRSSVSFEPCEKMVHVEVKTTIQ